MLQALLLCLSLGFCCLQVVISEIQLGSRLIVGENSLWESNNGDFALGFFNYSDSPNRFSIGIRFNSKAISSDQQTVVWVAGGAVTVTDNNSYFELTTTGELVLFDSSLGVPVWSSKKTSRFSASSALLRDDGNLVLLNSRDQIVWQSFDTPADTLLPGQKLAAYESLRAASENSRSSYYSLHMEEKLELRWESNVTFWSSGNNLKKKKKNNIGALLTPQGALFLQDQESTPIWSAFGEDHNDTVKFRFLRLDRDGNLRMYSWNDESKIWKPVWQAIENQCRVFATCGQKICSYNSSGFPECICPYTFTSILDPRCLAPYQKLACKSGFAMEEFKNMYLYGIYPANDSILHQISSKGCKKICLDDPSCTAVTYTNDGDAATCLVKLTRYISGYSEPSLSSISFVKRCLDPIAVDPNAAKEPSSSSETVTMSHHSICLPCLVTATSTTFVLFLGFQIGILVYIYRRKKQFRKKAVELSKMANPKGLIIFSVDEIKAMTDNFKHNLGPKMFKGVLDENELVAVTEMEVRLMEERKFRSSASKIGTMHHKNLAKLQGYCCELGKRYLVHEYATNGSLLDHITDPLLSKKLTWRKRTETGLNVAKALCYLHTECREFVSHGNLNCGNILLSENSEAKLTEYGFSSCAADKDVEDFGKTMLTLITGRYEQEGVSEMVYREWIEGRKETIVDEKLEGGFELEELERVLRISFWCIQGDERLRPSMGEVVKVLEGTLSVDPPPLPFTCVRSSPTNSSDSN